MKTIGAVGAAASDYRTAQLRAIAFTDAKSVGEAVDLQKQRAALVEKLLASYTTVSDGTDRDELEKTKSTWTRLRKDDDATERARRRRPA